MTFKLGNIMFVPFYHIYVFLNKKIMLPMIKSTTIYEEFIK